MLGFKGEHIDVLQSYSLLPSIRIQNWLPHKDEKTPKDNKEPDKDEQQLGVKEQELREGEDQLTIAKERKMGD